MKAILKIVFSFAILAWLVKTGKLNFSLVSQLLLEPGKIVIAIFALIFILVIVTYRWKMIVETRSLKNLPITPVLKGNWIGMFFNAVLPGSVSGDFIKIFYLKNLDPKFSKRFLLASSLIDRVIGLFGIIFLLGLNSLIFYKELSEKSLHVKQILDFNLLLTLGIIIGILSLFFIPLKINTLLNKFPLKKHTVEIWDFLVGIRSKLVGLIGLSVVVQAIAVIVFWYLTKSFSDHPFELNQAFSFVPLGFIGLAIPIAPSGLGVGHMLFEELFKLYDITNGASLFNLYFLVQLIVNLLGVVPYITFKPTENQIKIHD